MNSDRARSAKSDGMADSRAPVCVAFVNVVNECGFKLSQRKSVCVALTP